jgi:zinc protease
MELLLEAGGSRNSVTQAGLASLHAALLDEGTDGRNALEIATRVGNLGGFLGSAADWDTAYVATEFLTSHRFSGLDILAELTLGANFPTPEVERLKEQRLTEILRRSQHPSSIAETAFAQAIFDGTILAEPLIGTQESLQAIDREHCLSFYESHCRPKGSALVIVGDCDMGEMERRCEDIWSDWRSGAETAEPSFDCKPLLRTRVLIMDRPDAAQTELRIGHLGVPRSHPGYPARLVLNTLLGGKFTSRLNLNLREKHGYTYGIQSHFVRRRSPAPFLIRSAVETKSTGAAVGEIISELHRIRDEAVGDAELTGTVEYLAGVFPYTLQTASDIAHRLSDLMIFGLPKAYFGSYPATLVEVSPAQIQAAARELLHPDRLIIVAVGAARTLGPQLESFGPVEIIPT